ncbi:DNA polymerase V [Prunus yedoensis var. nudiflora]|uniref:DNA polymerase V n=1 Tax=Prunus yedoensis var. nudiflora TaxID=2094558 RepID=A0A314YDQ1_PRUYE|nr:DNA polymerase V [Prunus yedoensis var. nudiflora]
MDVLVDTLLSLLPQSSAPMRTSIELVFKYFCDDIADDGLDNIIDDDNDDDFINIKEDEAIDAETGETGESDEQSDDYEAVDAVEEVIKEIPEASDDSDGGWDDDTVFQMNADPARYAKRKRM